MAEVVGIEGATMAVVDGAALVGTEMGATVLGGTEMTAKGGITVGGTMIDGTEVAAMAVVAGTAMAVACVTPVATAVGVLLQAPVALALLTCLWTDSTSNGVVSADWTVDVSPGPIYAPVGSSVILQCSYDFPEDPESGKPYRVLSEMWCLNQSLCITRRYIYHSAGIFPEPSYQGRILYFGETGSKNCSLQISDLSLEDSGVYVFRFITDHPKAKLPGQRGVILEVTGMAMVKKKHLSMASLHFNIHH
ncbi:hypothetical protein DNTS_005486 [Danionella cerebrum]|uniref:Immunoglobulin domain-containing protein n=1 Tax=Danionella cerebrum TaxID=2873325 RepID=A0A553PYH5_9TELE|nr:hypothetical protein DNTS_005486 [Danionella translucida]